MDAQRALLDELMGAGDQSNTSFLSPFARFSLEPIAMVN